MFVRIISLIVSLFAAALLVTAAVANRHSARFVLDPFNPQNPVVAIDLPFYAYLFGTLILGVLIGGFSTWISQGKWRRIARARSQEAIRWKAEADRLTRERDATVSDRKKLVLVGR